MTNIKEQIESYTRLRSGFWVLFATVLGSGMAFIDSTSMNVILPVFQRELDATITQVQWIMEGYALFISSLILFGGALGDKYGTKKIFIIGVIFFAVASVLSGISQNIQQLIVTRMLQGIGGALLVPGSLSIINLAFDDNSRGKAIGVWAGLTALTTALGPIIGAWLAENYSWRLVFFINLPVALVVLPVLFFKVKVREIINGKKLDIIGSLLISMGLGLIVYGLIESSNLGFSNILVVSSLVTGIFLVSYFVHYESKIENPILPLYIFKSPNFSNANIITLVFWGAWNAAIFFLPLTFIQVFGYRVDEFAIALIPTFVSLIIMAPLSGFVVNKIGVKIPLIAGNLIIAVAYYLFTLPGLETDYFSNFLIPIILMGTGMGITISPLVTAVFGSVSKKYSGVVSGINNSVGRLAGLLAIAMFGIVAIQLFNASFDNIIQDLNLSSNLFEILENEKINLGGMEVPGWVEEGLKSKIENAVKLSFLKSFRIIMYICSALALISSLLAIFSIDEKQIRINHNK